MQQEGAVTIQRVILRKTGKIDSLLHDHSLNPCDSYDSDVARERAIDYTSKVFDDAVRAGVEAHTTRRKLRKTAKVKRSVPAVQKRNKGGQS